MLHRRKGIRYLYGIAAVILLLTLWVAIFVADRRWGENVHVGEVAAVIAEPSAATAIGSESELRDFLLSSDTERVGSLQNDVTVTQWSAAEIKGGVLNGNGHKIILRLPNVDTVTQLRAVQGSEPFAPGGETLYDRGKGIYALGGLAASARRVIVRGVEFVLEGETQIELTCGKGISVGGVFGIVSGDGDRESKYGLFDCKLRANGELSLRRSLSDKSQNGSEDGYAVLGGMAGTLTNGAAICDTEIELGAEESSKPLEVFQTPFSEKKGLVYHYYGNLHSVCGGVAGQVAYGARIFRTLVTGKGALAAKSDDNAMKNTAQRYGSAGCVAGMNDCRVNYGDCAQAGRIEGVFVRWSGTVSFEDKNKLHYRKEGRIVGWNQSGTAERLYRDADESIAADAGGSVFAAAIQSLLTDADSPTAAPCESDCRFGEDNAPILEIPIRPDEIVWSVALVSDDGAINEYEETYRKLTVATLSQASVRLSAEDCSTPQVLTAQVTAGRRYYASIREEDLRAQIVYGDSSVSFIPRVRLSFTTDFLRIEAETSDPMDWIRESGEHAEGSEVGVHRYRWKRESDSVLFCDPMLRRVAYRSDNDALAEARLELEILPKPVDLYAESMECVYGEAIPEPRVSGAEAFLPNDGITVCARMNAERYSDVGEYTIEVGACGSEQTLANYDIRVRENAILRIVPAVAETEGIFEPNLPYNGETRLPKLIGWGVERDGKRERVALSEQYRGESGITLPKDSGTYEYVYSVQDPNYVLEGGKRTERLEFRILPAIASVKLERDSLAENDGLALTFRAVAVDGWCGADRQEDVPMYLSDYRDEAGNPVAQIARQGRYSAAVVSGNRNYRPDCERLQMTVTPSADEQIGAHNVALPQAEQLIYDGMPKEAQIVGMGEETYRFGCVYVCEDTRQYRYDEAPSQAGEYRVYAYLRTSSERTILMQTERTMVILPKTLTVDDISFGGLYQVYDGTPKTVEVSIKDGALCVQDFPDGVYRVMYNGGDAPIGANEAGYEIRLIAIDRNYRFDPNVCARMYVSKRTAHISAYQTRDLVYGETPDRTTFGWKCDTGEMIAEDENRFDFEIAWDYAQRYEPDGVYRFRIIEEGYDPDYRFVYQQEYPLIRVVPAIVTIGYRMEGGEYNGKSYSASADLIGLQYDDRVSITGFRYARYGEDGSLGEESAAEPILVGCYAVRVVGLSDEKRYRLEDCGGRLTITPAPIDVRLDIDDDFVYDLTPKEAYPIYRLFGSDETTVRLTLRYGGADRAIDAGEYEIRLSAQGDGAENYRFNLVGNDRLFIAKRPVRLRVSREETVYGVWKTCVCNVVGGLGFLDDDDIRFRVDIPEYSGRLADCGTYPADLSFLPNERLDNYDVKWEKGALTVLRREIHATISAQDCVFDETAHYARAQVEEDDAREACAVTLIYTLQGQEIERPIGAGTYTVYAITDNPNYKLICQESVFTIAKADRAISPDTVLWEIRYNSIRCAMPLNVVWSIDGGTSWIRESVIDAAPQTQYGILFYLEGDADHNDSPRLSITVKTGKDPTDLIRKITEQETLTWSNAERCLAWAEEWKTIAPIDRLPSVDERIERWKEDFTRLKAEASRETEQLYAAADGLRGGAYPVAVTIGTLGLCVGILHKKRNIRGGIGR